ncbi:MAG: hypothetical protein K1X57_07180 [Gemmataceae bacterium]|nr:hypothetical protein [Gemmataceae bacterium]
MMWEPPPEHPLRRLFAGYTEFTFQNTFGVADPPLIDYLSGLLSRYVTSDAAVRLKDATGRQLDNVAELVAEVADLPQGRTACELHRQIGDFALFWTGVYPEWFHKMRSRVQIDYFVDYCRQGKRSYYLASQLETSDHEQEAAVLRRLSDQFEMCAFGLTKVREEWEKDRTEPTGRLIGVA